MQMKPEILDEIEPLCQQLLDIARKSRDHNSVVMYSMSVTLGALVGAYAADRDHMIAGRDLVNTAVCTVSQQTFDERKELLQ